MSDLIFSSLLDLPAFPSSRYAKLADQIAAILQTQNQVVFVQAEAIVALEASAFSLAHSGITALNIVTSPYGTMYGDWLKRGGANVITLYAETGRPVSIEAVENAFIQNPAINLLSFVHAESATGIANPLKQITAIARKYNALIVVDAVASVGGMELDVDAEKIDIAIIGPQKSLGGPAGISALSISPRAWDAINHSSRKDNSILSLWDQKRLWLDSGRNALPGTPSPLEFYALHAALAGVDEFGLQNLIAQHTAAARATQAAIPHLGLTLWESGERASSLVTAAQLPTSLTTAHIMHALNGVAVNFGPTVGETENTVLRLNHTGANSTLPIVLNTISILGIALTSLGYTPDITTALKSAHSAYGET